MKPAETKAIYESACRAKRLPIVQEEGEDWHKHFRAYEAVDVKTALDAWNASTDRDSKGDLKSRWLPATAELRPMIESAQRKRLQKLSIAHVYARWECGPCKLIYGHYVPENDLGGHRCKVCNGLMNEIFRGKVA